MLSFIALLSLPFPPTTTTSFPCLPSMVTVQCSDTATGMANWAICFQPFLGFTGSKISIDLMDLLFFFPPVARRYLKEKTKQYLHFLLPYFFSRTFPSY